MNTETTTKQERNREAVRKYRQTERGKAAMARYIEKRRERSKQAKAQLNDLD